MKRINVTLNDEFISAIKQKIESFVNTHNDELYKFSLFNALRNFKEKKPIEGNYPRLGNSFALDEWMFCELWRVKGLEFTADLLNDEDYYKYEIFYQDTSLSEICYHAMLVASYYNDPIGFIDYHDVCDQDSLSLVSDFDDFSRLLTNETTICVVYNYWACNEPWSFEGIEEKSYEFDIATPHVKHTEMPKSVKPTEPDATYYILTGAENCSIILDDGTYSVGIEHALINGTAKSFNDLDTAKKYADDYLAKDGILNVSVVHYGEDGMTKDYEHYNVIDFE